MQVVITYSDETALTASEVRATAEATYGKKAKVQVLPDSSIPDDYIYFGIQQRITAEQISLYFDDRATYGPRLQALRARILSRLTEILDTVILDNEAKIT